MLKYKGDRQSSGEQYLVEGLKLQRPKHVLIDIKHKVSSSARANSTQWL